MQTPKSPVLAVLQFLEAVSILVTEAEPFDCFNFLLLIT